MSQKFTEKKDIFFYHKKKKFKLYDLIFLNKSLKKKNYHWNDNKKLKRDLKYIFKFYKKLLTILTNNLNKTHKKKFPKKYWEILIWRWLLRYVIYLFDRWEIISSLKKIKENKNWHYKIFKFEKKKFIPNNPTHWFRLTSSDDWNSWIYSEILKEQNFSNFKYSNKISIKPRVKLYPKKMKKNIKWWMKFILKPFLSKKIIIQNLYFSEKTPISLKLFLNKTQNIDNSLFDNFKIKTNEKLRSNICYVAKKIKKPFEKFAIKQLAYNLPILFLENYINALKTIKNEKFPPKPKLIFCGPDQETNDPFKFYTAENIINKTKLYHLQHGGSYGTSDDYPIEKIQTNLNDKFFTWGWNSKNEKIEPFFCQKTININVKQNKNTKGVIIPIYEWNIHPNDIFGGRPRNINDINLYINNLIIFYSKLHSKIKRKSAFKFLKYNDRPFYILNNLKKKFNNGKFFHSHKNTINFLDKFKINVETVNSTNYLESFNLNLPTILIFDDQYCKLRKNVKKYFNMLEKSKIMFKNPKKAAIFINENYDKIDHWWNSKKVQKTLSIFTNNFAKRTQDPYTFYKKIKI